MAYRRILKDPRDEPQYAERVPYVISNADGRRLIDRARMPEEMLANRYVTFGSYHITAAPYISTLRSAHCADHMMADTLIVN